MSAATVDGTVLDPPAAGPTLAIEALGVKKVYGPTIALAGVDLVARPGEIHGLLGENGAGKSTLVRLLAGIERPDGGSLKIFGEDIAGERSFDARAAGCAFIHQDLALFPTASVAENIGLTKGFRRRGGLIDDRGTLKDTQELLDRLDMRFDARTLVGELPLADQTAVAIARALSAGVRLIVLDEPTAYLEERQVRSLMQLLRRLRDEGVACLLITHRAPDVLNVCDCLTVLREGETVAARPAAGMTESELVRIISGHAPAAATARTPRKTTTPVFELRDAAGPGFEPLSLQVGAGEIVGLCGLADAGTDEVSRVTFGIEACTSGEMLIDGSPVHFDSVTDAIRAKVAYVPRERRADGLAGEMTVRENLFLRTRGRWWRPIVSRAERKRANGLLEQFGVDPRDPERDISTLSGGNQQKVVVAKWCETNPRLLVLNEPTAGVDLGAKAEIHSHIRRMCETEGCGVLLISTDFSEVAELADRVYVMHRRHMFEEIDGPDVTAHRLVTLAYGRND